MKRSIFFFILFIQGFFPCLSLSQVPKKKINTASELPVSLYNVPDNLAGILADNAAYDQLALMARTSLEKILDDYEITDQTTLKEIHKILAHLDLQQGKHSAFSEKIALIHQLETKPEFKSYTPFLFEMEAMAKAQKETGKSNGDDFANAFGRNLLEMFNKLPPSFYEDIRLTKQFASLLNVAYPQSMVDEIVSGAKKNGNKINGGMAAELIEAKTMAVFFVPLAEQMVKAVEQYLATHKPVNVNIWAERAVTLTYQQKTTPVIVAIWDTGFEPASFSKQLFVNKKEKNNGKDNDKNGFIADINGIAVDEKGMQSLSPVFPLTESDKKKFPGWLNDKRIGDDFFNGINNEETRAFKVRMDSMTDEQGEEQSKMRSLFSFYSHGTSVAGIAADGNPAARLLNARFTWPDKDHVFDSTQSYEQWADGFADNIREYADYFKIQKVRVVNISWSVTAKEIEGNVARYESQKSAEEKKQLTQKIFGRIRKAMYESISNNPKILFVVSAGNRSSDADFNEAIPASLELPNLITVGAVDNKGAATMFTSFGKTVKLYALGMQVETPAPGGGKIKFGGTSAAAPQVTNLAAKMIALNPLMPIELIIDHIYKCAEPAESDKRLLLINPKRSVQMLLESVKYN